MANGSLSKFALDMDSDVSVFNQLAGSMVGIPMSMGTASAAQPPAPVPTGGGMNRPMPSRPFDPVGMSEAAINAYTSLASSWGQPLPVISSYRDPERNARVGGAKGSQHIDGNAFDIDVTGMPEEQRVALIKEAKANGFTGVGVYTNSLHFDVGPERAWGPDYSRNSLPGWAAEAVGIPASNVTRSTRGEPTSVPTGGDTSAPEDDLTAIEPDMSPEAQKRAKASMLWSAIGKGFSQLSNGGGIDISGIVEQHMSRQQDMQDRIAEIAMERRRRVERLQAREWQEADIAAERANQRDILALQDQYNDGNVAAQQAFELVMQTNLFGQQNSVLDKEQEFAMRAGETQQQYDERMARLQSGLRTAESTSALTLGQQFNRENMQNEQDFAIRVGETKQQYDERMARLQSGLRTEETKSALTLGNTFDMARQDDQQQFQIGQAETAEQAAARLAKLNNTLDMGRDANAVKLETDAAAQTKAAEAAAIETARLAAVASLTKTNPTLGDMVANIPGQAGLEQANKILESIGQSAIAVQQADAINQQEQTASTALDAETDAKASAAYRSTAATIADPAKQDQFNAAADLIDGGMSADLAWESASKTGTPVTNISLASTLDTKMGEANIEVYKKLNEQVGNMIPAAAQLETIRTAVQGMGATTAEFQSTIMPIKGIMARLGWMDEASVEALSGEQLIQAASNVLTNLVRPQSIGSQSNAELDGYLKSVVNVNNQPLANQLMLQSMTANMEAAKIKLSAMSDFMNDPTKRSTFDFENQFAKMVENHEVPQPYYFVDAKQPEEIEKTVEAYERGWLRAGDVIAAPQPGGEFDFIPVDDEFITALKDQ
jgi:hypothetical protein